jgi:hypothetical protein
MGESRAVPTFAAGRPATVRWIVALAWLRVVAYAMLVVAANVFVASFGSGGLEEFRRGWIEALGYASSSYGAREAGAIAGSGFLAALFSGLILWSVHARRLAPLRAFACLGLLFSLQQILAIPLALTSAILAFQPSVRRYCQPGLPTLPPPAQAL